MKSKDALFYSLFGIVLVAGFTVSKCYNKPARVVTSVETKYVMNKPGEPATSFFTDSMEEDVREVQGAPRFITFTLATDTASGTDNWYYWKGDQPCTDADIDTSTKVDVLYFDSDTHKLCSYRNRDGLLKVK